MVVAEILLNRLLHPAAFDFARVSAVVMDEFHSFADLERGIVWELSLGLLPPHVRLLLLSATVGNAVEFLNWLEALSWPQARIWCKGPNANAAQFRLGPRPIPHRAACPMAQGDGHARQACRPWSSASIAKNAGASPSSLKDCRFCNRPSAPPSSPRSNKLDWKEGVGPKIKQMLQRGVGVHHAGLLPKYRRIVEDLLTRKLLAVVLCTETLASGINLPARSVVLSSLVKGPPRKQKLIDASTAQQIFGRAGRPQFDDVGYVFAVAHEDDVKLLRWKEKFDQIPEDTRDPGLIKAKKDLKRKKPARATTKSIGARASSSNCNRRRRRSSTAKARSPGGCSPISCKSRRKWRTSAHLCVNGSWTNRVFRRREDARAHVANAGPGRLRDARPRAAAAGQQRALCRSAGDADARARSIAGLSQCSSALWGVLVQASRLGRSQRAFADSRKRIGGAAGIVASLRVPDESEMPPGPLARERIDEELIRRGLMIAKPAPVEGEEEDDDGGWDEPYEGPPALAEKMRLLFDALYPDVGDVTVQPIWAASELLALAANSTSSSSRKTWSSKRELSFDISCD